MTLLITEIHVDKDLRNSFIIFAADRRVTVNNKFHSNRKKVFITPNKKAGIGYFGLTQLNSKDFFSSWLPNFMVNNSSLQNPREIADALCEELNKRVDKNLLTINPSGFHICGYNEKGYPELQFVRNIGGMDSYRYRDFKDHYFRSEDFLGRDAKELGFDGINPGVSQPFIQDYINGDIRPFHSVWRRLDAFVIEMFSYPDFQQTPSLGIWKEITQFKMEVISKFYRQFSKSQIIGTPIDVFILQPD